MTFIDNVKDSVSAAAQTLTDAAQTLVEKNRINAQLNRLRMIMRNESELINRAYITLGKHAYNVQKNPNAEPVDTEKLCQLIDRSKQKIKLAQERYNQYLETQTIKQQEINKDELEDITVACLNEDEYETSPFKKAENMAKAVGDTAKDVAKTVGASAKETSGKIADIIKNRGGHAALEVKEELEEAKEELKDTFDDTKEEIKDTFDDTKQEIKNVFSDIKDTDDISTASSEIANDSDAF